MKTTERSHPKQRWSLFTAITILLLGSLLLYPSVVCFGADVGQPPKPSMTRNISALEMFADRYTTSLIYVGKVVSIDTGKFFGSNTEYAKTIEFDVQEYIAGGEWKNIKHRTIKGEFADIVVDKLYIVSQSFDDRVTALIPLDDSPDLVDKVKQIVMQSVRRSLIIDKVAFEIVFQGKPNWSSVRIYDSDSTLLVERFGSHHYWGKEGIQFIYGCSVSKKIEPYIHIQSLRIIGKKMLVTGTVHPNSISFSAELIEAQPESGLFNVTRLDLGGYLSEITLYTAALRGDITHVRRLIQEGTDVNGIDKLGLTPLHYAAERGHRDVAALLIERGGQVNAQDGIRQTPLFYAAKNGHKEIVALLIGHGALVDARNIHGYTPLHEAASAGYKEVAEFLIARGTDVNAKNFNEWTPLHNAAQAGHKGVAELLIAKGADVNAKMNDGGTPLHSAALFDRKDVAELLIAKDADVNAKNNKGVTPLTFAIRGGYKGVEELLRRNGGKE